MTLKQKVRRANALSRRLWRISKSVDWWWNNGERFKAIIRISDLSAEERRLRHEFDALRAELFAARAAGEDV